MDRYFFSEQNVTRLQRALFKLLKPENDRTKQEYMRCLIQHMKNVYGKYINKKPPEMSVKLFLDKMSKKSVVNCVNFINEKLSKRRGIDDKFIMKRDEEINGQRGRQLMKHPASIIKGAQFPGLRESASGLPNNFDGISGGYAPVYGEPSGPRSYITADGRLGREMKFGVNIEEILEEEETPNQMMRQGGNNEKKFYNFGKDKDSLEKAFLERDELMRKESGIAQTRPPEIDFTLVKGRSRNEKEETLQMMKNNPSMGSIQTTFEGIGGFNSNPTDLASFNDPTNSNDPFLANMNPMMGQSQTIAGNVQDPSILTQNPMDRLKQFEAERDNMDGGVKYTQKFDPTKSPYQNSTSQNFHIKESDRNAPSIDIDKQHIDETIIQLKKSRRLTINVAEITDDPENYNDFYIEMEPIKNVKNINIPYHSIKTKKLIYLYLSNIDKTKPFFKLDNGKWINIYGELKNSINLESLIFQFKDSKSESDEVLHNFKGKAFTIVVAFS
jgi:hypothetical protein